MCSKTNALGVKKIAIIMLLALTLVSCADSQEKTETKANTGSMEEQTEVNEAKTETKEMDSETKKDEAEVKEEVSKTEETTTEVKNVVSSGDTITVAYTGSTTDGVIFDASSKHPGQPLIFVAGAGQMIPGFDAWVIGMKLGEEKTIDIEAKDAYGASDVLELKEADLKAIEEQGWLKISDIKVWDNTMPKTGGILKIVEIKDWKFFAKHPNKLAWKDLIFEVKIESIK